MPERLMIDSGAFSVWSSGKTIDLDEYIRYCKSRPNIDVFVGLDVIPPKGTKLTPEVKDEVAKEGWKNYLKMIRHVPMEKVVPVYHRGDHIKWLETMLDFGCPYIGLAPRFDGTGMERRFKFLVDCSKLLVDSEGKCVRKVHGFAVTNHKMMTMFPWYSVDSATFTQLGSWGAILVPRLRNGIWDFTAPPYRIFCSIIATKRQQAEHHLLAMKEQRPSLYKIVKKWLDENRVGLGEHRIVESNGKRPEKFTERWGDRSKTKIMQIIEPGVCNYDQVRRWINAVFYHMANDALPIQHLYLAGNGPCLEVDVQIRYRLQSYAEGQSRIDWLYKRLGSYEQPFEYPMKDLTFSFK